MSEPKSSATERYLAGNTDAADKIIDLLGLKQVTSISFSLNPGQFAILTAEMLVTEQEGLEVFEYITKNFRLVEIPLDDPEYRNAVGPL